MDDSVKTQQLLISYAMQKGGWKNMPLPSDWIQISVLNSILYINCSGCTILDVHPFKYLALGNDKEKKWVKTHISQQYDAKKKKANYISCWATCPFPEKGWMILYHVTKNQILYYHAGSNTLTAKHPCRVVNKPNALAQAQTLAAPVPPSKPVSLPLNLDQFIENDLQNRKHGKSHKHKTASAKSPSNALRPHKPMNRRTKSSMEYKDLMGNRQRNRNRNRNRNRARIAKKRGKKSFKKGNAQKVQKMKGEHTPKLNKTTSSKADHLSISSISKTHKPRRSHHPKSKSMKMMLNGKGKGRGHVARNKHKLHLKSKPVQDAKDHRKSVRQKAREIERQIANNKRDANSLNQPKWTHKKKRSKTPKSKKKIKPLSERLGHPTNPPVSDAPPTKEIKAKSLPNTANNGYNWSNPYPLQQSSYKRSLSKSAYMYSAASRSNNVIFPIQNKNTNAPNTNARKSSNSMNSLVAAVEAPRAPTNSDSSSIPSRMRTRINRSKSNPDSDLAKNTSKHFKVASPNKRRRNAVGMSSQLELQSQLLALNTFQCVDDISEDTQPLPSPLSQKGISINLSLSVKPNHTSIPTTPTLLTQSTSKEDIPVGEAREEPFPSTQFETIKELSDTHEDSTSELDHEPSAAVAAAAALLPTATPLVVRDKKRSATCMDILEIESLRSKPRSRSHSRALRTNSRHSRASSLSSTSSRGSVSDDRHYPHRVRTPSSSSGDSSDDSSISSSVSNSYSTDSDSDSDMSSGSASVSSRSSRHSRSSSIHSRSSRSSTPISRADKLVNAQSSLLGNMANMMMLMTQQQQQQKQQQLQLQQQQHNTHTNSDSTHNKSLSVGFVNINDDATATQFDAFMTNFMTNFNSNGSGNGNNNNSNHLLNSFGALPITTTADNGIHTTNRNINFDKHHNMQQGLNCKGTIMSPIMLQNSMVDDTSCSASDNDIDTPTPV